MNLNSLYQELILDHSKRPHGAGLREPFDVEVHHHNPTCGDDLRLRVLLDGDTVKDVSYDAQGCSISVASTSMMTDLVLNEPVSTVMQRYDDMVTLVQTRGGEEPDEEIYGDAVALAGVSQFPARVKCALLGWAAVKDAVSQAADVAAKENA